MKKTFNKVMTIVAIVLVVFAIFVVCTFRFWYDVAGTANDIADSNKNYTSMLANAKEIKIVESTASINKEYRVYVDNERVATVEGKIINTFGEKYVLSDFNNNFILQEKQIKRWNVKINRAAEVEDENGKALGYIGENNIKSLFSMTRVFYFYNKNKEEIGKSKELFSFAKKNKYFDNEGNLDYSVTQQFSLVTDIYTLKINDTSDIPLGYAILAVCIDDSIKDNKKND